MLSPEVVASTAQQASLTSVFVMFIISVVITLAMEFLRPKPDVEGSRPKGLGDFQFPTATEDRMVPIVWGTMDIKGPNVTWFGDLATFKVRKSVSTGLFSSTKITTAVRYFVGIQLVLCFGPIDRVTKLTIGTKTAYSTPLDPGVSDDGVVVSVDAPELFGGTNSGGGVTGDFRVYSGTETQNVSIYLNTHISTPVPAYRGIAHVVAERPFLGESVSVDAHIWRVTRFPDNLSLAGSGHIIRGTIDDGDANPAEVLYELMTNDNFGLGVPPSEIDIASFTAAGDALATEENGWSSIQDRAIQGTDLIREVLRQIDGALFQNSAGSWSLRLFRDDYVLGSTPVFDETNIVEMESFNRQSWSQTQNDVAVTYVDRTKEFISTSVPAQDTANVLIQSKKVRADMSFPGIKHPELASQIAARELRVLSFPIAQIRFSANRDAASLTPGDVVRVTWPALDLTEFVVRVMSIDLGSLNEGIVGISGSQDFWKLPAGQTIMAPAEPTEWEPIVYGAVEADTFILRDAPRYINDNVGANPEGTDSLRARVMATPVAANLTQQDWFLSIDPDQTGTRPANNDFVRIDNHQYPPTGLLAQSYAGDTDDVDAGSTLRLNNTILIAEDLIGLETAAGGRWLNDTGPAGVLTGQNIALIQGASDAEDEFIAWETLTDNGGGVYSLSGVHRGLFDTRPRTHPVGRRLYFISDKRLLGVSGNSYSVGTSVDVYFTPWAPAFDPIHLADLDALVTHPITLSARQGRPLPPQDTQVDDGSAVRLVQAVDLDISGGGSLLTTWEHNLYTPSQVLDINVGTTSDAATDPAIEYDLTFEGTYSAIVWRAQTLTNAGNWREYDWLEATAQSDSNEAGNIPMRLTIKARRDPGAGVNPNLEALQDESVETMIDIGGGTNQSVDLDGSTEYLADATLKSGTLSKTFSFNFWVRPDVNVGGSERELFSFTAAASANNRIKFGLDDDANGGAWFVRLYNSSGTLFKDYRFGSYTSGQWFMVSATYNEATDTLLVYEDGALVVPGSTPTDTTGTMIDSIRGVYLGTDQAITVATRWQGLAYSASIYDRVLLGAEITSLETARGSTATVTPLEDFLNYAGAPDLRHYWDFRITDNTGLGQDFGSRAAANRWNLTDDALNVTTADLTATVPT
jgi:hypothetical protein